MEDLPTTVQFSPAKIPYSRTFLKLPIKFIAVVLLIGLPVFGFYLGLKYQKQNPVSYTPLENDGDTTTSSDSTLINDINKLGSEIIVSNWQTRIAVYLRRRDEPSDYLPFDPEGGSLIIYEDLVVLNLNSGERKVYEFSQDIIPVKMVEFLKQVPFEGGSHYRLSPQLLGWSPFSENVYWGKLIIYSNGDPPIANEIGLFKMDIKNSKIENFALPSHGLFGAVNVNTNAEKVLYESFGDDLSLYLYDLKSKRDQLIISYNKDAFNKYCASFIEYVYTSGFYGDCGRDRGLRAGWEETGLSYFDFITQKRVNLTTD